MRASKRKRSGRKPKRGAKKAARKKSTKRKPARKGAARRKGAKRGASRRKTAKRPAKKKAAARKKSAAKKKGGAKKPAGRKPAKTTTAKPPAPTKDPKRDNVEVRAKERPLDSQLDSRARPDTIKWHDRSGVQHALGFLVWPFVQSSDAVPPGLTGLPADRMYVVVPVNGASNEFTASSKAHGHHRYKVYSDSGNGVMVDEGPPSDPDVDVIP